jgi:hypothetical protein
MFSLQNWLSTARVSKAANHEAGPVAAGKSLSRFAAMPKLVNERELAELEQMAGFDSRLVRKLRAERRRAYRLYLSELVAEFRTIEREARDRSANDPGVDPGFAGEVMRLKARFEISVLLLRISLMLPALVMPKTHQWTLDLVGALPKH